MHQSYTHGSEHGWKANVAFAKERLQADYKRDMQEATAKFGIHEEQIHVEEFERGFNHGRDVAIQDDHDFGTSSAIATITSLSTNHNVTQAITDDVSVKRLVSLAKDSLPDSAFGIVWRYAVGEGVERGIERGIEIGRD